MTVTLTLDVPAGVAQQLHTLPDNDRRAFLQKMNAFAVATLAGEEEEAAYYLPDPSEGPPSTLADAHAVQEAFADFDAGDRGKSPQEAFARLAAKYNFTNPVL